MLKSTREKSPILGGCQDNFWKVFYFSNLYLEIVSNCESITDLEKNQSLCVNVVDMLWNILKITKKMSTTVQQIFQKFPLRNLLEYFWNFLSDGKFLKCSGSYCS